MLSNVKTKSTFFRDKNKFSNVLYLHITYINIIVAGFNFIKIIIIINKF